MNSSEVAGVDLNLLVVFDALMTERSVSRAATRLGLSQPAFSNALGRLRRVIGDPLFRPTGRGMIPTPRALTMAWPVQSALSQIHCALAGAPASPEPLRIVTVSANQYAQCLLLPIVLTLLGRIKKEIQLEMIDAAAPQASATPTADLTIEWSSRKQEAQNPPVVLLRDAWVGVIRRRNSRLRGVALRESLDRLMRSRQAEGAVFLSNGAALPSHHTADALGAMSVVSSSDAVAVVPRRLAARFARPLGLKILTMPGASDECVLSLSTRGGLDASVNGALQVVINSFVDAGKTLSRSRKA